MLTILLAVAGITATDTGQFTPSGLWFQATGSGPAVVLIHGADLDSRSFAAVAERLAANHRVVLVDLRFHGRSRDGGGPFSFEGDVEEVLDAAGVKSATLVGHSLGATVALDFALARPDRVERLVLIGPAISGRAPTRMPTGFEALAAAVKAGDFDRAGIVLSEMPVMTLYNRTDRQAAVAAMVRGNTRLLAADRTRVKPLGQPAANRLGELKVPVLVLMGGRDPTEANDAGLALVAAVRGAQQATFPACGHLVPIDCEPETIEAINRFLP